MSDENRTGTGLSKDAVQIIRGLIVGELITIAIIGGLWLWLRPRLQIDKGRFSVFGQGTTTTSTSSNSTFETVSNVPAGIFKHGGSTAWAPIRPLLTSSIQLFRPELQLRYVDPPNGSPGSGTGIRMLLDGELDLAESSRPFTAVEQTIAQQRGFSLKERLVAIDGVVVVVNPTLPVSGLTVAQLQQIYQGKITNWKYLGGPDLAIIPFSQPPESADTVLFSGQQLLDNQTLGSNVQYVNSTTEAVRRVSKTPGGVYYAPARGLLPQCTIKPLAIGTNSKQFTSPYREPLIPPNQCPHKRNKLHREAIKNGSYPLSVKLYVISKENKGQQQRIGEAYTKLLLTEQGQKAIEEAGLISVR